MVRYVRCSLHPLCISEDSSEEYLREVHSFQRLSGHLLQILSKDPMQVRSFLSFFFWLRIYGFSFSCFSFTRSRGFHRRLHCCHQNHQHEYWWSSQDPFNTWQITTCAFNSYHPWIRRQCRLNMLWKFRYFPLVGHRRIIKVCIFILSVVFLWFTIQITALKQRQSTRPAFLKISGLYLLMCLLLVHWQSLWCSGLWVFLKVHLECYEVFGIWN